MPLAAPEPVPAIISAPHSSQLRNRSSSCHSPAKACPGLLLASGRAPPSPGPRPLSLPLQVQFTLFSLSPARQSSPTYFVPPTLHTLLFLSQGSLCPLIWNALLSLLLQVSVDYLLLIFSSQLQNSHPPRRLLFSLQKNKTPQRFLREKAHVYTALGPGPGLGPICWWNRPTGFHGGNFKGNHFSRLRAVRVVLISGKGHEGMLWATEVFYILFWVQVTWGYTSVKVLQLYTEVVHLTHVIHISIERNELFL